MRAKGYPERVFSVSTARFTIRRKNNIRTDLMKLSVEIKISRYELEMNYAATLMVSIYLAELELNWLSCAFNEGQ